MLEVVRRTCAKAIKQRDTGSDYSANTQKATSTGVRLSKPLESLKVVVFKFVTVTITRF